MIHATPESWASSRYTLRIGEARRVSMFTRRVSADLPDDLPPHVQAFVLWLLVMLFRRETRAG